MANVEYLLTKATSRADRADARYNVLVMRVEDVLTALSLAAEENPDLEEWADLLEEALED